MDKASTILGGLLGGIIVLLVFAFVLIPPPSLQPPQDLIVSNGDELKTVGEQTPIPLQRSKISLTEIFEKSETGVVRINVQKSSQIGIGSSVASGFVFDKQGHIITNHHVVESAQKVTVTFLDGNSYNAEVIGVDRFTDIAVIKVNIDSDLLKPLPLGSSSSMLVGDQVAAIGNPFGLSGSMTSGIISQMGRLLAAPGTSGYSIPDVIQTDAAINPGNSGGPLLNMRGEVIGINTAIQSGTGEFIGIGFAIPSDTVVKIVPALLKKGEYNHPWMGISGIDLDPDLAKALGLKDTRGFLIVVVVEDSPAGKAGLRGSSETKEIDGRNYSVGGDIILSVDGKVVRKIDDILIHLQREK
ncbi:MAG: S1C family serine protease, partial [Nitrosopumilaceae archaeon]